jgi:hypothetical protein
MSDEKWMEIYVYTYLHENFFGEFLIILADYLERLVENTIRYRTAEPRNWTRELVRQQNYVRNKNSRTIDLWLDNIFGGYITKFAVNCTHSYSVAERDLFKGLRRRFMKSLGMWIKMLLCDKCVMIMESNC